MQLKKINLRKNKRAISEMIAYVLMIVIALSLAIGVYAWLKRYVPPENEREKCPDDVSIAINDYNCSLDITTGKNKIVLTLKNKGYFNIDGFYILASNDTERLPYVMLNTTEVRPIYSVPGTYFFKQTLKPGDITETSFSYTGLNNISRLRIQPFLEGKQGALSCSIISEISKRDGLLEGC